MLLDREMDANHNRAVVTIAGAPTIVAEAAFRGAQAAARLINLETHRGEHPRMGATDVIPFIPIRDISMDECVALARQVGERIGRELEIPFRKIAQALRTFRGIERRFQVLYDNGITVLDDYGHHPAEIRATLRALREAFPKRRLVTLFQPHRFTRTRDLFEDFVKVLSTPDELVLADVYPAGEAPIVGADGRSLARAIRLAGKVEPIFVEKSSAMRAAVLERVRDGDVVLTMGAGSIGHLAPELALPAGAGAAG